MPCLSPSYRDILSITYTSSALISAAGRRRLMAVYGLKFNLFFLFFFVVIFVARSRLNLHPSDYEALLLIRRDLGVDRLPECGFAGVFCERRVFDHSYVLRVTRLIFESRFLEGELSAAIGRLSELKEISLPNNRFSGQIPPQLSHCKKLQVLNPRNNLLSGQVSPALLSSVHLRVLDLSSNKFTGNLRFLKHLPNLEKLNLADNLFAVKVHSLSLPSFRRLRFINISGNQLEEDAVELAGRESFSVPKHYVFAENSTAKNKPGSAPAPSSPAKHKKNKRKVIGGLLGFLAGTIAGSASGLAFSLLYKFAMIMIKRRSKDKCLKIFSPIIKNPKDLAFLEREDGLASLEIIGKGGCGEVYKAVLPGSNGKAIAIKKIVQHPREGKELTEEGSKFSDMKMRQIQSEIETVGQIRHKNLLPLLAHMPRPDCHYLVYEYMKNGSLQDYLQLVAEGKKQLDWLARYKIAVGVAMGLEYLHMNQTSRIIHRDLKPANILLDDEMEARIADFGLAKIVPDSISHITTSNIAGTAGFIAPEYHQTCQFTEKCDMYSFGVLLGCLVMGKLPSDVFFQHIDEVGLVKWMRNVMSSEEPTRAIDPSLLGNGYEEQMLLALKVACFCTLDNPKSRPSSKEARCMLSQITH